MNPTEKFMPTLAANPFGFTVGAGVLAAVSMQVEPFQVFTVAQLGAQ